MYCVTFKPPLFLSQEAPMAAEPTAPTTVPVSGGSTSSNAAAVAATAVVNGGEESSSTDSDESSDSDSEPKVSRVGVFR